MLKFLNYVSEGTRANLVVGRMYDVVHEVLSFIE